MEVNVWPGVMGVEVRAEPAQTSSEPPQLPIGGWGGGHRTVTKLKVF